MARALIVYVHNVRDIVIITFSFPNLTVTSRRFNTDVGVAFPC